MKKELRCDKCDLLIATIDFHNNDSFQVIGEIFLRCPNNNCDGDYEE